MLFSVPYRDSKLTRLLKDSLGGNAKTLMIACINPAEFSSNETLSTLRYATRAKKIKNKPKINEDPKDAILRALHEEIDHFKHILVEKNKMMLRMGWLVREVGEEVDKKVHGGNSNNDLNSVSSPKPRGLLDDTEDIASPFSDASTPSTALQPYRRHNFLSTLVPASSPLYQRRNSLPNFPSVDSTTSSANGSPHSRSANSSPIPFDSNDGSNSVQIGTGTVIGLNSAGKSRRRSVNKSITIAPITNLSSNAGIQVAQVPAQHIDYETSEHVLAEPWT